MKSPDEFHYGIEEPPRKRQICTCDRCDSGIFPGEIVVTIQLPRKTVRWCTACANVRLKLSLSDILDSVGIDVSECNAEVLEEE
jgi:hypothetical protein